jgi:hypothetical protein
MKITLLLKMVWWKGIFSTILKGSKEEKTEKESQRSGKRER